MEYKQMTLAEWLDIKQKLKQDISSAKDKLNGLKKDFVRIGYLLRKIDDNELYKQDGYKSIAEFAKAECGLSPSDTTRFIQINKKYSIGGNSEELRPEFLEYGQSKLAAMLALPDADLNMITPQTSREDIRELNRFNKSDPEQGADDDIEQLIRDFYVSQELVRKAVTVKDDPKALCELIAPSGSRSFRKGIWFILFHENKINIKKYSGVAKEISWEEFTKITAKVLEKYEPDDATREENTDGFKGDSKDNKQDSIDFKDNSTGISDATLNKFVEFAEKFEQEHSGYFVKNKLQLKSLSVVDDLSENGVTAAGAYYSDSQSIKLMKKAIETKPTSKLFTYSRSDDYEMHFFAHEYGHYIADSLSKKLSITDYDIIQKSLLKYFDGDIFKTKTSNLVDVLGSYGSENAQEAFAEAFAEAYTCKEPGRFASIFKEELEKVLDVSLEKKATSDIMVSGARITDIFSKEADEFAEMYYKEIRSFSTDAKKIAENLNKKESDIRKIKSYLFEDKSLLDTDTGEWRRFDPDCAIAQSWQRLMIGKDIKPHDKTLIEHELLEMKIKKENPNMEHWKAHEIASEKYDYPKEATEYYGNLEKHKKNK